ncbi:hypothetical protein SSX86_007026 [Deinandra increscens subsp. villosa]|uniref:non-specific serine/threonine protein kinase n=1 Tax=Deinandra increscens subsp. villosa TaxID=3103831 RepID=A0AAP0H4C5_9ASTR
MKKLLFFAISLILYSNSAFRQSAKLDAQEVKALKEIWGKLKLTRKKEWNFEKDPCSGEGNWRLSVGCNCSFETNTTCHVTHISITSQYVAAILPWEFAKLQFLQSLDLDYNYLRGTIPSNWATMRLTTLSLMGNRLSGLFPTALARMTTLQDLNIEGNQFKGSIPEEIAKMKNLERLVLSSNDFSGQLPDALSKLTNLTDLRISDNNFTGKIPRFISKWTQIRKLHIQGCSFEGAIPSSISVLTQLNDLRISDLKGGASTFPPLQKMTHLKILVLRNCLIYGPIPYYVGYLRSLQTLDLSFNNLTGDIPYSFSMLKKVEYIYLTENNLTGLMPEWFLSSTKVIDVSYNHFTWDAYGPKRCEEGAINVVESYSSSTKKQNDIHPCLRKDFPCTKLDSQKIRSLHINCGGEEVNINNFIKYDADTERRGASTYYNDGNWAFSSTGNFLDDDHDSYILFNTSNLHSIPTLDTDLYTTARTSAISLTYYGLCLANGDYTVRLHFAEIVFTQDNPSGKLGKRVFDVYVQGELKLKDFDIVEAAGGIGKAIIKSYIVNVKNNTLKIRLYWAGKGTTGIPYRGCYGPIISAISVNQSK